LIGKNICWLALLVLVPILVFAGENTGLNLSIDPAKNVGEITRLSNEQDLIRIYGKKNVKRIEVGVGEGEVAEGTILFPNTDKQISIEWKEKFNKPDRFTIYKANSAWRLKQGIRVGDSLEKVKMINNSDFKITGFEWDYPGRTVSWGKGLLPNQLQLDFEPSTNIPWAEFSLVLGDKKYSSKNKVIRKLNLKIRRISIRWDL